MSILQKIAELEKKHIPFAVVTIIHATASCPGRSSFKMAVTDDGSWGSIGGGAVEYAMQKLAREMIRTREKSRMVHESFNDENGDGCGGEADIFIETFIPAPMLYIMGGGHICQALSPIMTACGFAVTVIDNRPEFASKALHPTAEEIKLVAQYEDVANLEFPVDSWFVIVTHGHEGDEACLRGIVSRPELQPHYVGLIGSARKLGLVFTKLMNDGISRETLEAVHSPIGLDLGGNSAAEVAVSIAAEIIAARYGRSPENAMKNVKHVCF